MVGKERAYQKEKKSLTSFSLVCKLMFLTLTVDAMVYEWWGLCGSCLGIVCVGLCDIVVKGLIVYR